MEDVRFELFTVGYSVDLGAMLAKGGKAMAYASRTLNSAKRSYAVTERESLAVICALEKLKSFILISYRLKLLQIIERSSISHQEKTYQLE